MTVDLNGYAHNYQTLMGCGEGVVSMEKKEIRFWLFCLHDKIFLQKLHLLESCIRHNNELGIN